MEESVVGEVRVLPESEQRPGYSSVEWRIPAFVFLPENKRKEYKSDSFEFSGERWHLYIGRGQQDNFDLGIAKKASPRECSLHFEASFKRSDGTLKRMRKKTFTFKAGEHDDYYYIIDVHKTVLPDEHDTVVFSFLTDGQHRVSLLKSAVDIACVYKLSCDFRQLLLNGEGSDLIVKVKGVEFRLHSVIMGVRTPVFSAMLSHDMKEKATGVVCIDDCEPEVFQSFVGYLYSGRVNELSRDIMFGLFAVADKYQVDELKSACLEFIGSSLSVDTFCDVLNLALTYEQGQLLEQATDFFVQNIQAILPTVKWMNYLKDHHIQANELILKAVQIISK